MKNIQENREKYWSEIDNDEKIKRLRRTVKRLEKRLSFEAIRTRELRKHSHGDNGQVLVPLSGDSIFTPEETSDDVYM